MHVLFSARATNDLLAIAEYIAVDDPSAAEKITGEIIHTLTTQLKDHPRSGRPGRVATTRELVVHRSYIVAYRVQTDQVEILYMNGDQGPETVKAHLEKIYQDTVDLSFVFAKALNTMSGSSLHIKEVKTKTWK